MVIFVESPVCPFHFPTIDDIIREKSAGSESDGTESRV